MTYFKWSNDYELGVEEIDKQHQTWLGLLEQLYDAMSRGDGSAVIGKVLDNVLTYTKVHFSTEEKLMESHGYPGLADHKTLHKGFIARIDETKASYDSGSMVNPIAVANALKSWLLDHICTDDRLYVPYVKSHS